MAPFSLILILFFALISCIFGRQPNALIRREHGYPQYANNNLNGHQRHDDKNILDNKHRVPYKHPVRQSKYDEDEDEYQFSGMIDYENMGEDNYDDLGDDDEDEEKYSDKKQLVALLLCLFVGGFGGGRFYIGDYGVATVKLMLTLSLFIVPCFLLYIGCCCQNGAVLAMPVVCYGCIGCAIFIFQLTDIILFAINDIPDGNGLTLKPM